MVYIINGVIAGVLAGRIMMSVVGFFLEHQCQFDYYIVRGNCRFLRN